MYFTPPSSILNKTITVHITISTFKKFINRTGKKEKRREKEYFIPSL